MNTVQLTAVSEKTTAAEAALTDWRNMTTDLRAAALATVLPVDETSGTWPNMPASTARFLVNACRCEPGQPWHVEVTANEMLTIDDANAFAVALQMAAATAASLNVDDRFSIACYGIDTVGRDEAKKIGSTVPLIATSYEGMSDLRIDLGKVWADKLTHAGAR